MSSISAAVLLLRSSCSAVDGDSRLSLRGCRCRRHVSTRAVTRPSVSHSVPRRLTWRCVLDFARAEKLSGVGSSDADAIVDDDMFWEPPPIRVFRITCKAA